MAHIVVYLQRTPQGLHPGSAVALCWARDIASERGASVTAVGLGDAGAADEALVRAASRFGADAVTLCAPGGLARVCERLHPVHTLVPWTPEGLANAAGLPMGPVVPRWVERPNPAFGGADALTAVLAGAAPWHDLPLLLEPEVERGAQDVELPPWTTDADASFALAPRPPLGFLSTDPLDPESELVARLRTAGFAPLELEELTHGPEGTALWLVGAGRALPPQAHERAAGTRLLLLTGAEAELDPSWSVGDAALRGPWPEVLSRLAEGGSWTSTATR